MARTPSRIAGVLAACAALSAVGSGVAVGTTAGRPHRPQRWVTVPDVTGNIDYPTAYLTLHRAALTVSTSAAFQLNDGPTPCPPFVGRQHPAAGRRVPAGSDVLLTAGIDPCGAGSPAVPPGPLPQYTVPNFHGAPLTSAIGWARRHGISWDASHLPPLHRAAAATLVANYVVTSQSPAAGTRLAYGFGQTTGNSGTFTVTPLELGARQRPRAPGATSEICRVSPRQPEPAQAPCRSSQPIPGERR